MNKKICWGLLIFVLLVLGIWFYSIGLKFSRKVSEEKEAAKPEIFQEKAEEAIIISEQSPDHRIKARKISLPPKKKVIIPSDYEPVSPEKKGIENFEEERKRESQRKDRGIPTG